MYNSLKNGCKLENVSEKLINEYFKDKDDKDDKNYIHEDYKVFTNIFKYMKNNNIDHEILNDIHHFKKFMIVNKNDLDKLELKNFKICLINSDFSTGFKIRRELLYELLVNTYNMYATYEPDIYPGVNSKFYWNRKNIKKANFGICSCNMKCDGKGNGDGDGNCKKVTIAIFQSGKIIITGARNLVQINDSYEFINKLLDKHYDYLKRKDFNLKKTDDLLNNSSKYVYINSVKNFELYKNILSLSQKDLILLSS